MRKKRKQHKRLFSIVMQTEMSVGEHGTYTLYSTLILDDEHLLHSADDFTVYD